MRKIGVLILGLLIASQAWAGEETRELSSFSSLDIGGAFKVTLKKTGKHRVFIDADDNVIDRIRTEVVGSTLKVYIKDNNFRSNGPMNLTIEFSNINGMDLSGASTVVCDDVITASTFDLDVSGAGSTRLIIETDRLRADMTGAGTLTLRGKAKEQIIDITGAGSYNAEDFDCDYTEVESSGAGTARVVANKELRAECSGAGSVRYKGDPEKVYADSNGAGSVKRMN
ncbi:MAG: head GIN domain-containing protein [Imperialibacter sp.]|uniref:head GIN domain-containing protein n=1 Tax=Imperialibacter sp. TaxID=2038411 RepID=UPI003A837045